MNNTTDKRGFTKQWKAAMQKAGLIVTPTGVPATLKAEVHLDQDNILVAVWEWDYARPPTNQGKVILAYYGGASPKRDKYERLTLADQIATIQATKARHKAAKARR